MLISRKQLINWIIGAAPRVHICTNQDESQSFDTEGLSSFYTEKIHIIYKNHLSENCLSNFCFCCLAIQIDFIFRITNTTL